MAETELTGISSESRIFVAGHTGLVGSAIVRRLQLEGFAHILTAPRHKLDLREQAAVNRWFEAHRPEFVFLAAGTVGGIIANATRPAEFIFDNLMMQATVLQASHLTGVHKLLALGSSCIYPKLCPQPMKEEYLLTGTLEATNEPYAIAKIAGLKMCESYRRQYGCNFISAMPTNLYGPNDDFDLTNSHVIPALVRKFHEAKMSRQPVVDIWGSGQPRREFLHVDDLADACLFLMRHYNEASHINVGTGIDLSIRDLAEVLRSLIYPDATIQFNSALPDGTLHKLLDVSRLRGMGWTHRIGLEEGLIQTYQDYLQRQGQATV